MLAQEEARALDHAHIGTEHLLLGLIHDRDSVGARALESLDISLAILGADVRQLAGAGQGSPANQIPFTPRAKKTLELSLRAALEMGHNYIGTEHILLGLLAEGDGKAAQVLVAAGADARRVREQVTRILSDNGGKEPAPAAPRARPEDDRHWRDGAR